MGHSDFKSFYTTNHILHVPENNSVDLPRVPYPQLPYLQEKIWLFRPISGLISTSRVVIPRHGQPGLNENWSNKAINLSKESETKKILCNTFMVPLCTKHRHNGVIKKHSYINAVHIICIYIYINKLGLLINKSILLRNPVRAPFQELLVGTARPGAH